MRPGRNEVQVTVGSTRIWGTDPRLQSKIHIEPLTPQKRNHSWPTVDQKPYREHKPLMHTCFVRHTWCSSNKLCEREENVNKKIIRKIY